MTVDKLKEILKSLNEKGLPIPLFSDHGEGSVSLTLLLLSFGHACYIVATSDSSDSMMYSTGLFALCASGYFSKRWQIRKLGVLDVGEDLPVPSEQTEKK